MPTLDFTLEQTEGRDMRLDMDYDVSYAHTTAGTCSVPKCRRVDPDVITTKLHHATHHLGHMYTRCPECQARHEAAAR